MIEGKFDHDLDHGSPTQGFWFDWEFARILGREASGLLHPAARS
jgi:hypothetical protein